MVASRNPSDVMVLQLWFANYKAVKVIDRKTLYCLYRNHQRQNTIYYHNVTFRKQLLCSMQPLIKRILLLYIMPDASIGAQHRNFLNLTGS